MRLDTLHYYYYFDDKKTSVEVIEFRGEKPRDEIGEHGEVTITHVIQRFDDDDVIATLYTTDDGELHFNTGASSYKPEYEEISELYLTAVDYHFEAIENNRTQPYDADGEPIGHSGHCCMCSACRDNKDNDSVLQ